MAPGAEKGDVLVGDVGGTHARFGLADGEELKDVRILTSANYETLEAAAADYLAGLDESERPLRGSIAVAGPVLADRIQLTNRPWNFSVSETRQSLGLKTLEVLNDLTALALAAPRLTKEQSRRIKKGKRNKTAPMVAIGVGTGLGVSPVVPTGDDWMALDTEGGHRDLAAATEREWRIIETLQHRFGRVSAERALSGPGLVNVYQAICELAAEEPQAREPEGVVARALNGSCPLCQETVELLARQLGAFAGDLVLTYGALGGVWIGGGVVQAMSAAFDEGLFTHGFLDKGRFRGYLEPVPVRLVLDPTAGLLGAARALASDLPAGIRAEA